jgi:hypothetical protein
MYFYRVGISCISSLILLFSIIKELVNGSLALGFTWVIALFLSCFFPLPFSLSLFSGLVRVYWVWGWLV